MEFGETSELCDVWRVRNTKSTWFTFTKKIHASSNVDLTTIC